MKIKKSILLMLPILGLLALGGMILKYNESPPASAAPTVLSGSLQGGCYLTTATTCKLSVEPFSIHMAPSETLLAFHLTANDHLLYDFGASTTTPILNEYTPSPVALDFAARCGETYTIKLHALDTGDLDFVTIGQTQVIRCPTATYKYYVPLLER
jgi:hypothetical protein